MIRERYLTTYLRDQTGCEDDHAVLFKVQIGGRLHYDQDERDEQMPDPRHPKRCNPPSFVFCPLTLSDRFCYRLAFGPSSLEVQQRPSKQTHAKRWLWDATRLRPSRHIAHTPRHRNIAEGPYNTTRLLRYHFTTSSVLFGACKLEPGLSNSGYTMTSVGYGDIGPKKPDSSSSSGLNQHVNRLSACWF